MTQGTNLTIENRRAGGRASGYSRQLNTTISMLMSLPPIVEEDREKLHRAVDAIPTHEEPEAPPTEPTQLPAEQPVTVETGKKTK